MFADCSKRDLKSLEECPRDLSLSETEMNASRDNLGTFPPVDLYFKLKLKKTNIKLQKHIWICKKVPPGFFSNSLIWGLFGTWTIFFLWCLNFGTKNP